MRHELHCAGKVSGGVSLYFMAFVEALCLNSTRDVNIAPRKKKPSRKKVIFQATNTTYTTVLCPTTVVPWSHKFHVDYQVNLEFHVSKVYVDWLLGQSFGRWRSSKQGPTTVGMVRLVILIETMSVELSTTTSIWCWSFYIFLYIQILSTRMEE